MQHYTLIKMEMRDNANLIIQDCSDCNTFQHEGII